MIGILVQIIVFHAINAVMSIQIDVVRKSGDVFRSLDVHNEYQDDGNYFISGDIFCN